MKGSQDMFEMKQSQDIKNLSCQGGGNSEKYTPLDERATLLLFSI